MQLQMLLELTDETEINVVVESSDEVFALSEEVYLDLTKTKEIDIIKYN